MGTLPRVAVVGAGAVGGYFGGMFARAGAQVTMIGRPQSKSTHLETIGREGLRIDGVRIQETIPVEISRRVESVGGSDLVLFCVKTVDTESAARNMEPHLGAGALVLSMQNGIDNAERMAAVGVKAASAVVFVAAAVESPGVVRHRGRGDLVIGGDFPREKLDRVAGWFEQAEVPCLVSNRVERELWLKLIINSMANATSALTGASYRALAEHEPTWNVAVAVATEAIAVAASCDVELDLDDVLRKGRAVIESVGDATSSTEQDIAAGRPTEIDSLNGYIARKGREAGVATPANDTLHALVKLREK